MTTVSNRPSGAAAPVELVTLTIDGVVLSVPKGTLVIRAAEQVGIAIPRFCDHPLLDPVGACRQCLVEVAMPAPDGTMKTMQGPPGRVKPQASCTLAVGEGMVVNTQLTSPIADKAQHGVMEALLINHPLDCPVCDKGGECPLQNQAMSNGAGETRFLGNGEVKRTFAKPINISAQVLLDRERCVLCARCTRFSEQIAGDPFIALIERGALQQVGIYEHQPYHSNFSGNVIQICPVGALTSASYRFRARPFDLVSTTSVAEHDSCGAEIRVDHRRGKVVRRLSGNDPEVNEEWISDRDRFAFGYATSPDRLTYPQVRDATTGELRVASWPEAFAVAARGLEQARDAGGVGVLTGGRLTREDAYAYAKFARVALGSNDIDFRARVHSEEEADFLAALVAGKGVEVTYADVEKASAVLLVGLEPEEEAPTLFLRLRKARKKSRIWSVAPFTTRGLEKLNGTLVPTRPGAESAALEALAHDGALALDMGGVILVGERMAAVPGGLSAVAALAAQTGARLAWVPRRAGERPALDAGCLPTLLPGGRPVTEASARVDVGAVWGTDVPAEPGRDATAILAAAAGGQLAGLVVAGVDPTDTPDPAATLAALAGAAFVVSLEVRDSAVCAYADVVLPVAAPMEKSGSFTTWEGRVRPFPAVLTESHAIPDVRALAGISEELRRPLGFRTPEGSAAELAELGEWDGARVSVPRVSAPLEPANGERAYRESATESTVSSPRGTSRSIVGSATTTLVTWKTMVSDGPMSVGDAGYHASGPLPVAVVSPTVLAGLGLVSGDPIELSTASGSVTLLAEVGDIVDGVVWAPTAPQGVNLRVDLGAGTGDPVRLNSVQVAETAPASSRER